PCITRSDEQRAGRVTSTGARDRRRRRLGAGQGVPADTLLGAGSYARISGLAVDRTALGQPSRRQTSLAEALHPRTVWRGYRCKEVKMRPVCSGAALASLRWRLIDFRVSRGAPAGAE